MSKYIIANWKMYLTPSQSEALALRLGRKIKKTKNNLVICPSFSALSMVEKALTNSVFALGAQDVFWENPGAYTGEEAIKNLKELGCRYIIVGHSERRSLGETDEQVARKLKIVLDNNLIPIFCIGETMEDKDAGKKKDVLRAQLRAGLALIKSINGKGKLLIAYEPVWAIGTGRAETPENAAQTHNFIKEYLEKYHNKFSDKARIIYGGSVTWQNIKSFMKFPQIEGALIGGASAEAQSFSDILKVVEKE